MKFAPGAPAVAKNYLLGLTGVPFALYFIASMLITGAYAALCVILGGSLFEHDIGRLLIVGGVAVVLCAALWWWRKREGRDGRGALGQGSRLRRDGLARGT